VNFIQQKARESAFSRNLRQAELGQDNCIKARVTQEEIENVEKVNFYEIEKMIHDEFKKNRAKVPTLKRNLEVIKQLEGTKLQFRKENEELARASKQDYTKFLEAFVLFAEKIKDADELYDLADKISAIILKGLKGNSPRCPPSSSRTWSTVSSAATPRSTCSRSSTPYLIRVATSFGRPRNKVKMLRGNKDCAKRQVRPGILWKN